MIKVLSKKDYAMIKPTREDSHWEGKHFCNCRTRNIRRWLGVKRYGHNDVPKHHLEPT